MSNSYNLSNQKLLHDIKILEENLHCLKSRTLTPPCISIIGIDKLQIRPLHHTHDEPYINDVIKKLFIQLKIPHFWIHSIEIPQNTQKSHHHLPSTVNIYLITDNIKARVYNILIQYLKHTDQKSVSIKLHYT
jgi:hypothetical protein